MARPNVTSALAALTADLEALALDESLDPGARAQLLAEMRPVIGHRAKGGKAPLGASKLGGRPHVDPGFVWPTAKNMWHGDALEPLAFLLQLDIAQLAIHDISKTLPKNGGRVLFFALPIEYDPDAWKTHVHVVKGKTLGVAETPRGLAAADGVFTEKTLESFSTVVFPDPNGGFLSFDDENERKLNRVLKKHEMRPCDIDSLLDRPRFSSETPEGYSPKRDIILLRFFGEKLTCKGNSPWFETEMLIVIKRDALAAGDLGKARLVMGEGT